ncbi:MAG: DinB family protein [Phycisphaerales bacterium]
MRDLIIETLRYERAEALKIARSVPDGIVAARPGGLAQSPAWIVCHLYLADNLLGKHLGLVPGDMQALFEDVGPGSDLDRAGEALHTHFGGWGAAIDAAANSHRALLEAIAAISEAAWAAPHPKESVREYFPTIGHNVVYNVWHEGNHGGQLRAWMHAARYEGVLTA